MVNLPFPSWRQLLGKSGYDAGQKAYWGSEGIIYTRSSSVSLALIFSGYRYITKCDKVDVFIPEFFCREILEKAENHYVQFHTYEVGNNFEPDWKKIQNRKNEKIDIFIFSHFLGVYHDISRAKNFCTPRNIILIEDCTQVLFPASTYGKVGDFVIYSPYKVFAVPDGGILVKNRGKNRAVELIYDMINKKCNIPARDRQFIWRAEKAAQKIIRMQGKSVYEPQSGRRKKDKNQNNQISSYAMQLIKGISYKEFKKMAYIRRCNVQVLDYLIKWIDDRAIPVMTADVECPFVAAYLLEDVYDIDKFVQKFRLLGISLSYPLGLPKKVESIAQHLAENKKSHKLVTIPAHQGIKPQQIARLIPLGRTKKNIFSLEWLEDSEEGKIKYQNVNNKIEYGNIPQEWDYGEVKCKAEHWKVERAVVKSCNNQAVGIVQMLKKQKGGVTIAVRINRGPLLIPDYDKTENKLMVMELVRKEIPHPIPIIYAPSIEFTGKNLGLITAYGWRQWNLFGFSSGIIDLQAGEEDIRRSFEKHWRNRLAYAERDMPIIKTDFARFEEVLDLYEQSQMEKHFTGVPRNVLQELLQIKNTPLQLMYLTNEEDKIIAFDIFYVTDNFGLYLVGWNSPEGRKRYLNNLLFYNAAVKFKKAGIRWLDLGGIDYIETEENARFKDGMRPQHFQLLGEFIRF